MIQPTKKAAKAARVAVAKQATTKGWKGRLVRGATVVGAYLMGLKRFPGFDASGAPLPFGTMAFEIAIFATAFIAGTWKE